MSDMKENKSPDDKGKKTGKLNGKTKKILIADAFLAVALVGVLAIGIPRLKNNTNQELQTASIEKTEVKEEDHSQDEAMKRAQEAEEAQIAAERAEAERIAAEQAAAERQAAEAAEAERLRLEEEANNRVHLCMVGDVLLASAINATCQLPEGGYDYNALFANVAPYLTDYDLKIVNEETPCGGTEYGISGYPSFNSPHEAQDAMVNAGFNVVCLATNHMLDLGTGPLYSTLNYWHSVYPDIKTVGAYDSAQASEEICVYEKNGFRIAILNYTYGSNAGSGEYYDDPTCLNILYEDEVRNDIRRAKEVSDYVIVCPHWGTEYNLDYDGSQAMWAQIFLQEGVDLVLGTHPHVPEPIEVFTDENGHQMICYYSLGNFVSNQDNAYSLVGGMADVTIRKTADGVVVEDFGIVPLATHKSYYYSTYLLQDYSNDMAYASNALSLAPDFSWDYCYNLVTSMYGDRLRKFNIGTPEEEAVPEEGVAEAPSEGEVPAEEVATE